MFDRYIIRCSRILKNKARLGYAETFQRLNEGILDRQVYISDEMLSSRKGRFENVQRKIKTF